MTDYKKPDLSVEHRVDDLINRLDLDEKIAQLHALWLILDESGHHQARADTFTGKPVVAVLTSGRPYNLGGQEAKLAAQVMAWFGGEQGGLSSALENGKYVLGGPALIV